MNVIKNIVGRCHVFDSNRSVINYVVSRFEKGRKSFLKMKKKDRKKLMRLIVKTHKENLDLYNLVMWGGKK